MASEPFPNPPSRIAPVGTSVFIATFALFLASFPAQNIDVWNHVVAGRSIAGGALSSLGGTWLYDVGCYILFSAGGGWLLAGAKALVVVGVGLLVLCLGRRRAGVGVATCCAALALLAASQRMLLQPMTVSYLFLALTFYLVARRTESHQFWPGTLLFAVFLAWANTDRWAVLGLGAVVPVWLGRRLDGQSPGNLSRRLVPLAILVAACAASPAHVRGLRPPQELLDAFAATVDADGIPIPHSPFGRAYLASFQESPAARAYYVLLALSGLSFLLARKDWRWERFLPWLLFAVAGAGQARAIGFFAVVAGPILAWNVADFLARRPPSRRVGRAAFAAATVAGAVLLACAWPGWLQGSPYGARQWSVVRPVAIERAAAELERGRTGGLFPAGTRSLLAAPETAGAFAWFGPGDPSTVDAGTVTELADPLVPPPRERLRAAGISRVVVPISDRGRILGLLERLMTAPDEWPLLHAAGGVAIFGWRDPERSGEPDPFAGREVNFERLAFRPTEDEMAPSVPPNADLKWWEAFWRPVPIRSPDRDEVTLYLLKAEADRLAAPSRLARSWEGSQTAAILGFAGTGAGAVPAALALRVNLFAPPPPSAAGEIPAITRTAFEFQQYFVAGVGDVSPAPLFAAIRAARRGIAANPADAGTFLALGRCYLQLQDAPREREWAARFPLLGQLRLVQASAALNRAVALNPALSAAHLELALLYRRMNCGDLAVAHLKAYRVLQARSGRPVDPRASDEAMDRLDQLLERHARALATEAGRASSADRAQMAARRGLAGEALRLLLESDVSSFGTQGMRLELDLFLKTGRSADLLVWATPELRDPLGAGTYHWMRAQAHLAGGDYSAADVELGAVTESPLAPATAGPIAGRIAAKAVLDTRPASVFLPDLLWRALSQNDFRAESLTLERAVSNQCDVAAVRGLMALEVGDAARAADAFRTALEFGRRDGPFRGFSFPAEPIALTGLKWLGLEAAR